MFFKNYTKAPFDNYRDCFVPRSDVMAPYSSSA
jgi:hypothetical protein